MTWFLLVWLIQQDSLAKQRASVDLQNAGIDIQRAAIRRHAGLTPPVPGDFFVSFQGHGVDAGTDCEPLPLMKRRSLIDGAAKRAGIRPELLEAVMQQESAFRPCSVSPKGAVGLMQLMPATSQTLGVKNPLDPDENVAGGAALLRQLFDRYGGDLNRVLGAYNAGVKRVDDANGVPSIPETENYVERILSRVMRKD